MAQASGTPVRARFELTSAAVSLRAWIARELAWGRLIRLGALTLQVALLLGTVRYWNLESKAFENVFTLAAVGFLVHHFLPVRARLPFFTLLSIASILIVFGAGAGASLLAIGLALIALSHLPARLRVQIWLLIAAGGLLALVRLSPDWLPASVRHFVPGSIWPILGSMFMFRMALYVYDRSHGTAPRGAWRGIAYFFMLPNVCFPLFPVVDYQTFCRNHYNDDPLRIYQVGVKWVLRGILQLLVYRFIYMRCMIHVADVKDALDVGQYMLTTFLLYLKISGLFHLVIGMLHLYGFNLPETHHLYLLSSSFTDFWRRINIYWKEFITKLVFYPLYFRWRGMGDSRAVVMATLTAFLATWLLHSYQWFWIRGSFPVVWSDLVFWFGLGVVVVLNVQWEQRRGRRRTLGKPVRTWRSETGLVLRVAGTFISISILWTIWSTPRIDEIQHLLSAAARVTIAQAGILVAVPLGFGLAALGLGRKVREHTEGARSRALQSMPGFWPSAIGVTIASTALVLLAKQPFLLIPQPTLAAIVGDLRDRGLNRADVEDLHRGYYEDLGDVTRFDNELWRMYGLAPKDWGREMPTLSVRPNSFIYEHLPNQQGILKGSVFSTNSHGMRDREYSREKPPGTFRIALFGASHDAGSGVADGQTYEAVAESLLNSGGDGATRVELLNFATAGYCPILKLACAEERLPAFRPDIALWVVNSFEFAWTFFKLEEVMKHGQLSDYPFLVAAMRREGLDPDGPPIRQMVLERRLAPQAPVVLEVMLDRFANAAREMGVRPIVVLAEYPIDEKRPIVFDQIAAFATNARMEVLDLYGALSGVRERETLWVAPWDSHTNASGHRLIGERLAFDLVKGGFVPAEYGH